MITRIERPYIMLVNRQDNPNIVKMLLRSGLCDSMDSDDNVALTYACKYGHYEVVKTLVEHNNGVTVDFLNRYDNKTPLIWAREMGFKDIVSLLEEYRWHDKTI